MTHCEDDSRSKEVDHNASTRADEDEDLSGLSSATLQAELNRLRDELEQAQHIIADSDEKHRRDLLAQVNELQVTKKKKRKKEVWGGSLLVFFFFFFFFFFLFFLCCCCFFFSSSSSSSSSSYLSSFSSSSAWSSTYVPFFILSSLCLSLLPCSFSATAREKLII